MAASPAAQTSPGSATPKASPWTTGLTRDRFILKELVSRDFKNKYRRSVLGVAWSVLNPLLMMIVMAAVFSNFMRVGGNIPNFPLYLIIGNTTFSLLSESSTAGMSSIIDNASLLKKVKINRIVFPLEKVVFALVNFAFSLIAVAIVMVWFQIPPSWNILWIPLFLAYLLAFCAGISMALSALSVFFRDVMHLWSVVLIAWTYLTPIFYSMDILPEVMQRIIHFNPMYQYITYLREILLYQQAPTLLQNLWCLIPAAIMLFVGWLIFARSQRRFILFI